MHYAALFMMLSGICLQATDDLNEEERGFWNTRFGKWVTSVVVGDPEDFVAGVDGMSTYSFRGGIPQEEELIPQQATFLGPQAEVTAPVAPVMSPTLNSASPQHVGTTSSDARIPTVSNPTATEQITPAVVRATFEGKALSVKQKPNDEPALDRFYTHARQVFLGIILNPPIGFKKNDFNKTPLDDLIDMTAQLAQACSTEQTADFRQAAVVSLKESRDTSEGLRKQYEGMRESFQSHLAAMYELSHALHNVIGHNSQRGAQGQPFTEKGMPSQLMRTAKSLVEKTQQKVLEQKKILLKALSLMYTLYPESSDWEVVESAADASATQKDVEPSSVEDTALPQAKLITLKDILGVETVPNASILDIPAHDTSERAYLTFLHKVLGTDTWVLREAKEKGKLVWVTETPAR